MHSSLSRLNKSAARPATSKSIRPTSSQRSMQFDATKFAELFGTQGRQSIRPKKELNTDFFHSILHRMKMQRENLDQKIKYI